VSAAAEPNYFGVDARQLAAMVPGCDKPPLLTAAAVVAVAPGLKPFSGAVLSASSASECILRGYGVIVFAFRSMHNEKVTTDALLKADDFYAQGLGWSAAPTATSVPETERSVVQPVALTLGGEILSGRPSADGREAEAP
jgi:hypothetical protein